MLINDFFSLINLEHTDNSVISIIKLNSSHTIFKAHFPNNPVTPGVVQLQIVKEVLEYTLSKKYVLKEMGRCKFLAILNPNTNPEIIIKLDYNLLDNKIVRVSAKGTSKDGKQTFFKFTAKYE